ncbi:Xanthine dehydrogenase/oxidase [Gossypium arboreum]|uniref:Xanthine dehydrogenase/oxidase n=1 Tax=Gossypium arboreum TaxID=29729 RepID=A0A0B0PM74_GOSAR|nr:Xanthine dehydrogenase/oxidase [Gossypium arboreum]
MNVKVCTMDELPCYTEPDEFEYKDDCDNLDEYDEVSDSCETVPETYPNEVVFISADNLHSIIHEACHEQSKQIEEYETRKPGESSNLGVDTMSIAGKESLRGMQFTYAVEVDEDPQPWVKEKLLTTNEEYEMLGDICIFGTAELGTNIGIIEKECRIQKQFSAFVVTKGDQQSWRKEKPLTTEVAVLKYHVPSFDVTRELEGLWIINRALNSEESPLFDEGFGVLMVGLAAKTNQLALRDTGVSLKSQVVRALHGCDRHGRVMACRPCARHGLRNIGRVGHTGLWAHTVNHTSMWESGQAV